MPEVICLAVFRLYFEIEIIQVSPGFEDGANLDLTLFYEKRDGPFVCSGTS